MSVSQGIVVVKAGEFKPGHQWTAGKFSLCFSGVGNLELRDITSSAFVLWQSGTSGGTRLAMQEDGNLVIYHGYKPLWASGTDGNPNATLRFSTNGNLVICSANGKLLWDANVKR
jgi:hypothetical protein